MWQVFYDTIVLFLLFQCQLEFTDDALKAVAHIAMEKQTGARGLRTEVVCSNYIVLLFIGQIHKNKNYWDELLLSLKFTVY
jgi:ATP-dependent protease Clp ATPase subunit